jgi:DNA-binding CsgD family transcriptional regulator
MVGRRVLVVDDAHACDDDTIAVLDELALLRPIVAASRPPSGRAHEFVARLSALGERLDLAPLDDRSAADLVRRRRPGVAAADVSRWVRDAKGSPLLLECLTDAETPAADVRIVSLLQSLNQRERLALARLAVAGMPVPPLEIGAAEIAGLDERRLVERGADGVTVRHALLGDAAIQLVTPEELAGLHEWAATRASDPARVATHLQLAGDPRAATIAREAAGNARTPTSRAALLAIAADGSDDVALVQSAALALMDAGRYDDASRLVDRLEGHDDDAHFRLLRARCEFVRGDNVAARVDVDAALTTLAGTRTPDEVVAYILDAKMRGRVEWDLEGARSSAARAVELAEAIGAAKAAAYSAAGSAFLASADPAFTGYLEQAIDTARVDGDMMTAAMAADTLCMGHLLFGDPASCRELADEMMRDVAPHSTMWLQQFRKNRLLAAFLFDADDASVLAEAPRLVQYAAVARTRHQAEALLVLAYAHRGDDDAALDAASTMRALTDGDATGEAIGRWSLAEAHWLAGRADLAYDVAAGAAGLPVVGFPAHVLVAAVGAWAALDAGRPLPDHAPTSSFVNLGGPVSECEALQLLASEPAEAAVRFEVAAEEWSRVSPRYALRAQLGCARALYAAGAPDDAIALLSSIQEDARTLGSVPLERRARAALRRLGVRRNVEHRASGSQLSPTERVVLDLVGRGLTSQQIARRLWIASGTVESHIDSARRKLNATTRLQAAAALTELGAIDRPARYTITDDRSTYGSLFVRWQARHGSVVDLDTGATVHRDDVAAGRVEDMAGAARVVSAAPQCTRLLVYLSGDIDPPLAAAVRDALARLGTVHDTGSRSAVMSLSASDRAVLDHLAAGRSLSEIAVVTNASRRTVERQLQRVRAALGVRTNAEAVTRSRATEFSIEP